MYLNVRSPEECFHNALSIIHALRTLGMDYDIHPTDIMQPNAINMLLFVTHLYITLPQYKLVAKLTFAVLFVLIFSNPALYFMALGFNIHHVLHLKSFS